MQAKLYPRKEQHADKTSMNLKRDDMKFSKIFSLQTTDGNPQGDHANLMSSKYI